MAPPVPAHQHQQELVRNADPQALSGPLNRDGARQPVLTSPQGLLMHGGVGRPLKYKYFSSRHLSKSFLLPAWLCLLVPARDFGGMTHTRAVEAGRQRSRWHVGGGCRVPSPPRFPPTSPPFSLGSTRVQTPCHLLPSGPGHSCLLSSGLCFPGRAGSLSGRRARESPGTPQEHLREGAPPTRPGQHRAWARTAPSVPRGGSGVGHSCCQPANSNSP